MRYDTGPIVLWIYHMADLTNVFCLEHVHICLPSKQNILLPQQVPTESKWLKKLSAMTRNSSLWTKTSLTTHLPRLTGQRKDWFGFHQRNMDLKQQVSRKRKGMRWQLNWQKMERKWHWARMTSRRWTLQSSPKWRTWQSWLASMKLQCCTI